MPNPSSYTQHVSISDSDLIMVANHSAGKALIVRVIPSHLGRRTPSLTRPGNWVTECRSLSVALQVALVPRLSLRLGPALRPGPGSGPPRGSGQCPGLRSCGSSHRRRAVPGDSDSGSSSSWHLEAGGQPVPFKTDFQAEFKPRDSNCHGRVLKRPSK